MPKGVKKAGTRHSRQLVHQGAKSDFTLYDFAHIAPTEAKSSGRVTKGASKTMIPEIKDMIGQSSTVCNSLAWYEKDLSDFDLSGPEDNESEHGVDEEEDKDDGATVAKIHRARKCQLDDQGIVWPLDLWFLVSKFISPEDTSVFARICRGSHLVTHSANCWTALYKRHFNPELSTPRELRAEAMDRVHGLRQRVIRSLYLMYPLFQTRLQCTPFENDPDSLIGARCMLMWYQKVKRVWHFFFKFHRASANICPFINSQGLYQPHSKRKQDYLMEADNIHYNSEEDSCVLQVVSNNFIALPVVMGQFLVQVAVSVGHGMRYHKLKLIFKCENVSTRLKTSHLAETAVVLDPVANIKVLQWWDPKYPRKI